MKGQQLPSLNGWRAVGILLVLGCHTTLMKSFPMSNPSLLRVVFDSDLGVRFFFGISGFLITWLMLKEEIEFSQFSLKNFYIRRTLRIWPVYLTYVFLLGLLQFSGIARQHEYAWRGLLTFTRNFYDEQLVLDESTGSRNDGVSVHCWSLSIEEQFYLFWPLAFYFLRARGRIWFLVSMILISAGFRTILMLGFYDVHFHVLFQGHSTFVYLDCLGWGCLGAFWFVARKADLVKLFERHGSIIASISISMILIPCVAGLGRGVQALGFMGLLLHSVISPNWGLYRILNFKWMNRIGVLSYSLYIWQEIVWVMWPASLRAVWFFWIPVTFGISWISYEFLEKPFLTLRAKFRDTRHLAR